MLFKSEHILPILKGRKTATRRSWKKCMVKVGNVYKCKTQMLSKESFAEIRVTKVFKQMLGDMTIEDVKKEGYDTLWDFKKIWIKINGLWLSSTEVYVIEFELTSIPKGLYSQEVKI